MEEFALVASYNDAIEQMMDAMVVMVAELNKDKSFEAATSMQLSALALSKAQNKVHEAGASEFKWRMTHVNSEKLSELVQIGATYGVEHGSQPTKQVVDEIIRQVLCEEPE